MYEAKSGDNHQRREDGKGVGTRRNIWRLKIREDRINSPIKQHLAAGAISKGRQKCSCGLQETCNMTWIAYGLSCCVTTLWFAVINARALLLSIRIIRIRQPNADAILLGSISCLRSIPISIGRQKFVGDQQHSCNLCYLKIVVPWSVWSWQRECAYCRLQSRNTQPNQLCSCCVDESSNLSSGRGTDIEFWVASGSSWFLGLHVVAAEAPLWNAEIDLIDREKSPCWVPKKLFRVSESHWYNVRCAYLLIITLMRLICFKSNGLAFFFSRPRYVAFKSSYRT